MTDKIQNAFRKNSHLPALRSREGYQFARLEVDQGNTGFWEGHEFRLSYEFNLTTAAVFKFSCSCDVILQNQSLFIDDGALRVATYRADQGVESGSFDTAIPFVANNTMSDTPDYVSQASLTTGATADFTPTIGELPVEVLRLRSANATAQKTTISSGATDERGLAAGNYYVVTSFINGATSASGVYVLKWEERPSV